MMNNSFGQDLLAEHLKRNYPYFEKCLQNKTKVCQQLEDLYQEDSFIELTIEKELVSRNPNPASMKLFFLKRLGSEKLDQIINKWKEVVHDANLVELAESFIHGNKIIQPSYDRIQVDTSTYGSTVSSLCNESIEKQCSHVYGPAGPIVIPIHVYYGINVASWLTTKATNYGLYTGNAPDNEVTKFPSVGCFTNSTSILLQDGTLVSIDKLSEGDKIVCAKGKTGMLSSEKVENSYGSRFMVYGFNEEDPFFLGAHPFWTQEGWKAIHPDVARSENPSLRCGELKVGDFVMRMVNYCAGNRKVDYEWVEIMSINFKPFPAYTKMYGVHTTVGSKSYHANGYVVCENYPQITLSRLREGMENLSINEKKEFAGQMAAIKPALEKVVSKGITDLLIKTLTEDSEQVIGKKRIPPTMPCLMLQEMKPHGNIIFPRSFSYIGGELFLDNEHVPDASVQDDDKIKWAKQNEDGSWEHGVFRIHNHGLSGVCYLTQSEDPEGRQQISSTRLNFATPPIVYKCKKSIIPMSEFRGRKNEIDFGELQLEVSQPNDETLSPITAKFKLPGIEKVLDFDSTVDYDFKSGNTRVSLIGNDDCIQSIDETQRYKHFGGEIGIHGDKFEGFCIKHDPEHEEGNGEAYYLHGESNEFKVDDLLLKIARERAKTRSFHFDPDEDFHLSANPSKSSSNIF